MKIEAGGGRRSFGSAPRDTAQWNHTPDQLRRRELAEEKGIKIFEASGAAVGDYVIVKRFFDGERGEVEGYLRVRREFGTGRYLEIFVNDERIRFRNIYSIEVAI